MKALTTLILGFTLVTSSLGAEKKQSTAEHLQNVSVTIRAESEWSAGEGSGVIFTRKDKDGNLVEMGSMVDQMDETSNPFFYANIKNEEAIIWNSRRNLLREIMTKFGFAQHPNEWWHFSYGEFKG